MTLRNRPERHALLSVAPADWPRVLAARPLCQRLAPAQMALVEHWGQAGWPVIARRHMRGDGEGALPVGLPLPPALGKARIALAIPSDVSWHAVKPVALAAIEVPPPWRETVDALLALGRSIAVQSHLFGALLWRSVTGLPYVHEGSDIDLLWPVRDPVAIGPLLDGLLRIETAAPMRIDGEIITPRGGFAWRELATARRGEIDTVLVKSIDRVSLVPAAEIFASAAVPCC